MAASSASPARPPRRRAGLGAIRQTVVVAVVTVLVASLLSIASGEDAQLKLKKQQLQDCQVALQQCRTDKPAAEQEWNPVKARIPGAQKCLDDLGRQTIELDTCRMNLKRAVNSEMRLKFAANDTTRQIEAMQKAHGEEVARLRKAIQLASQGSQTAGSTIEEQKKELTEAKRKADHLGMALAQATQFGCGSRTVVEVIDEMAVGMFLCQKDLIVCERALDYANRTVDRLLVRNSVLRSQNEQEQRQRILLEHSVQQIQSVAQGHRESARRLKEALAEGKTHAVLTRRIQDLEDQLLSANSAYLNDKDEMHSQILLLHAQLAALRKADNPVHAELAAAKAEIATLRAQVSEWMGKANTMDQLYRASQNQLQKNLERTRDILAKNFDANMCTASDQALAMEQHAHFLTNATLDLMRHNCSAIAEAAAELAATAGERCVCAPCESFERASSVRVDGTTSEVDDSTTAVPTMQELLDTMFKREFARQRDLGHLEADKSENGPKEVTLACGRDASVAIQDLSTDARDANQCMIVNFQAGEAVQARLVMYCDGQVTTQTAGDPSSAHGGADA